MRNMSFSMTTDAVREGCKTLTTRMGWAFLKPGDQVMACVKCMGLQKGERIEKIRSIRVVRAWWEPLNAITQEMVDKECLPGAETPSEFVAHIVKHYRCADDKLVHRIEFEYV